MKSYEDPERMTVQIVNFGSIVRDGKGSKVIEVSTEEEGYEYIEDLKEEKTA